MTVLASTSVEVRWWLRAAVTMLREYPGHVIAAAALLWLVPTALMLAALLAAAITAAGLRTWAVRWPATFTRWASGPVRGWHWRWWARRHWPEVARACDLTRLEAPRAITAREAAVELVPAIREVRVAWPRSSLTARMLLGQTVVDYEQAGDALRTSLRASQVRVESRRIDEVTMTFTIGDLLATPFDAEHPRDAQQEPAGVPMGKREDGDEWQLSLGPHTLVAGCSGAGKGSVFWSFAFGLAPAVAAGRVQLHGIDLKGGMEVLMGARLFTMRATSAAEAVVVLETLVAWMRERTAAYAGRIRSHTATRAEPLHVVMIDELAALTAYCPERDLQRRAELAINLLCSQGRAPGFMVFACLQDPRKEVIPSRGLFTQMVGLRLKDVSETSMVLGEVAVLSGAHCHRIPRTMPGTGYVLSEDGSHPIRVRTGFASDAAIRAVAAEFASPAQLDTRVPESASGPEIPGPRRPRQQGAA